MPLVMKKPPSWMNSAPPAGVTANMPSESSKDSNALPNQRQKKEEDPPFIRMKQFANPSKKSGLKLICPVQNASRSSYRCGFQDMFKSSANYPRMSPMPC
jgi:hypothetical protein